MENEKSSEFRIAAELLELKRIENQIQVEFDRQQIETDFVREQRKIQLKHLHLEVMSPNLQLPSAYYSTCTASQRNRKGILNKFCFHLHNLLKIQYMHCFSKKSQRNS